MTSNNQNSVVHVDVVKGSASFAAACRATALSMAMVATCTAAVSAPASTPDNLKIDASLARLTKLIGDQTKSALNPSSEQAQTLAYGRFPPVKTSISIDGKRETHWTMNPFDLVRLSRDAATKASHIEGVKVSPELIGAIMIAESSMVARTGWSTNGKTASYGLGQLEGNTAKALGVVNPNDPEENALAVGRLAGQALKFARANGQVDPKLAVSLAYNTSTALRKSLIQEHGSSLALKHLPPATQHHVKNMAYGQQLMASFSKISDQYEASHPRHHQANSQINHKENSMDAAQVPRPSTNRLMAGQSTDSDNSTRIRQNQESLEKNGHLQPTPMTTSGLQKMRELFHQHVNVSSPKEAALTMMRMAPLGAVGMGVVGTAAAIKGAGEAVKMGTAAFDRLTAGVKASIQQTAQTTSANGRQLAPAELVRDGLIKMAVDLRSSESGKLAASQIERGLSSAKEMAHSVVAFSKQTIAEMRQQRSDQQEAPRPS